MAVPHACRVERAAAGGAEMESKYAGKVAELLEGDAHAWLKGLTKEEEERLRREKMMRYGK
ncbi:MAG: hypothetical protein AB1742_11030 [bacterium]